MKSKPLYWLLKCLSLLPYWALMLLARVLAWLAWSSNSSLRWVTERNIKHCFATWSSQEQRQFAKKSLLETAKVAVEMPKVLLQKSDKSLGQIVAVNGKAYLDDAQQAGKGVVVLAPHLGNWEYLGLWLGANYDCVSLFKPSKNAVLNAIVEHGRSQSGARLMPTNKKGVLAVLKHIRKGGVTGILPDQVPDDANSRVYADFYGHKAPTMTLVGSLLQKPNMAAVVAFARRAGKGQFVIEIQPVSPDIYNTTPELAATAVNQAVESVIALAPEQYQWEYKRFKYNEAGEKHPLYKKA